MLEEGGEEDRTRGLRDFLGALVEGISGRCILVMETQGKTLGRGTMVKDAMWMTARDSTPRISVTGPSSICVANLQ